MPNPRRIILETLSRRGPLPVEAIAASLKLSKMAARYHLGMLMRERLVVRQPADHCGCVGRPKGLYALSDRAGEQLHRPYEQFTAALLDEMEHSLGRPALVDLLQRTGRAVAATATDPTHSSERSRWSLAARFMRQRGYAARLCVAGDTLSLAVSHCPYHKLTRSHHPVCAMDMAMVQQLLGASLTLTQSIARGDSTCRFVRAA